MTIEAPFGRMLTAMVTPFDKDGKIDWPGVEKLAAHLVANGHDGIAVNGTTGEAPTTKSSEKEEIIRVVKGVVGPKIFVVSGAGDNETDYSINQAKRTEKAGADGLLVVAPYYNKPPQAGVVALGTHLNKQGINPFAQTGAYAYDNQSLYFNKVKANPNDPEGSTNTNRLVEIYNTKQSLKNDDPNVRSYPGGPNSDLGAGKTNIRFADQRTGDNNAQKIANPDYFSGKNQQKSVKGQILDFKRLQYTLFLMKKAI